jgi:hypothetical protein
VLDVHYKYTKGKSKWRPGLTPGAVIDPNTIPGKSIVPRHLTHKSRHPHRSMNPVIKVEGHHRYGHHDIDHGIFELRDKYKHVSERNLPSRHGRFGNSGIQTQHKPMKPKSEGIFSKAVGFVADKVDKVAGAIDDVEHNYLQHVSGYLPIGLQLDVDAKAAGYLLHGAASGWRRAAKEVDEDKTISEGIVTGIHLGGDAILNSPVVDMWSVPVKIGWDAGFDKLHEIQVKNRRRAGT